MERSPGKFSPVTMDSLEVRAMTAALDPSTDLKELKIYLELLLRWQQQKVAEEQVNLKLHRLEPPPLSGDATPKARSHWATLSKKCNED
jgi:hypothetical protein